MDHAQRALLVKAYRLEAKFPSMSDMFAGHDDESLRRQNRARVERQRRDGYNVRPSLRRRSRLSAPRQTVADAHAVGATNRPRSTLRRIAEDAGANHDLPRGRRVGASGVGRTRDPAQRDGAIRRRNARPPRLSASAAAVPSAIRDLVGPGVGVRTEDSSSGVTGRTRVGVLRERRSPGTTRSHNSTLARSNDEEAAFLRSRGVSAERIRAWRRSLDENNYRVPSWTEEQRARVHANLTRTGRARQPRRSRRTS